MKLLSGEKLEERARQLGVDILGDPRSSAVATSVAGPSRASDHELQRRVLEAERSRRESRLWIVALVSAIASVASALTALIALWRK